MKRSENPSSSQEKQKGAPLLKKAAKESAAQSFPRSLLQVPVLGSLEAYEAHFDTMVQSLMNECALVVAGKQYRILELEMYFNDKEADEPRHMDHFAHCDSMQKKAGRWYFHRTGSQYRGGTYKGVDITCGTDTAYGGILVRTIQRVEDGTVFCGPCVVVNAVLEATKEASIREFVEAYDIDCVDNEGMALVKKTDWAKPEVHRSARIGLTLNARKKTETPVPTVFLCRHYRWVTYPQHVKKHKHMLAISKHRDGLSNFAIAGLVRSSAKPVARWVDAYESGRKMKSCSSFYGHKPSVYEVCQQYGQTIDRDVYGKKSDASDDNNNDNNDNSSKDEE